LNLSSTTVFVSGMLSIYSNGSAINISVAYSGTGEWQAYFQIIAA